MAQRDDIFLATLVGIFTGDATAVYPSLKFIASQTFAFDVWIVKIEFSTSLTIFPSAPLDLPGDLGVMVITMGKQSDSGIAVSQGLQSVIGHGTAPNSIVGPPAFALPSSKVSPISFDDCGYFLPSNTPISLYAAARVNGAGNFLWGMASIQYRRAD